MRNSDHLQHIGTEEAMTLEDRFGAHNYKPLPVVLAKGSGVYVYDPEGKRYYDFLSAYSALNQGHCHPRLINVVKEQVGVLTLTSRAFYNDRLGLCEEYLTQLFGYDKILMMNSGAEAVETAVKLARRWGYVKKGIPDNKACLVVAANNFHGRTTGVISFSTDKTSRDGFGPYMPGTFVVPFSDLESLKIAFDGNPNICAYLVEPIQGEAGVIVPDEGYLAEVRKLCTAYNILLVCDEIQTGLGRTGRMLCSEYDDVKPDILILGKALSGGMMPISAALCNDDIMLTINPGEHGSTFGGNALAAAIAIEAVKIIIDENMAENAFVLGEHFRKALHELDSPLIKIIRGKGLLNAIRINDNYGAAAAWDICLQLKENGLLAKQTHGNVIRFAPPLCITREQIDECIGIISDTLKEYGR
jgi:ornithine--oxo-acid transaminase